MASLSNLTRRLLVACSFAAVAAAAPVVVALSTPAGPAVDAVAECPQNEVLNTNSGACQPITDVAPQTTNPIEPGVTDLAPNALTQSGKGQTGELPEIAGIPCNGGNNGLCMGLNEDNPNGTGGVTLPPVPIGVTP